MGNWRRRLEQWLDPGDLPVGLVLGAGIGTCAALSTAVTAANYARRGQVSNEEGPETPTEPTDPA